MVRKLLKALLVILLVIAAIAMLAILAVFFWGKVQTPPSTTLPPTVTSAASITPMLPLTSTATQLPSLEPLTKTASPPQETTLTPTPISADQNEVLDPVRPPDAIIVQSVILDDNARPSEVSMTLPTTLVHSQLTVNDQKVEFYIKEDDQSICSIFIPEAIRNNEIKIKFKIAGIQRYLCTITVTDSVNLSENCTW